MVLACKIGVMRRIKLKLLTCLIMVLGVCGASAEDVDFVRDIQPILRQHCGECHSGDERNGGISFDDFGSVFGEADSGQRGIVANDPASSEILKRITSTDDELKMPPDGERLTAGDVKLIRRWIAGGAEWPNDSVKQSGGTTETTHWSFQPVADAELPAIKNGQWSRSPIDQFIEAKRDSAGVAVASDADATTLIRRASFVLTGLPPKPDQVDAFLANANSRKGVQQAFAELVDDLLSRQSYGQRWGRHWMDWVRYADTAGDNSDFPIPQAYLYRNYIIDSLNDDVPYDQFLIEQLAGDLLPADSQDERNRLTIATGYLAMARRFGSLIERYPWHLTIEDTIDNVGRTMMGLTISCARCHDHKFDPISTRDYYGLYGIFASTRYPQPGLELFQAQQYLVPLVPEAEVTETLAPSAEKTKQLTKELEEILAACEQRKIENASKERDSTIQQRRKMRSELNGMLIKARRKGEELAKHLRELPAVPVAYAVQDSDPVNASVQIKGDPARPGAEVARKFPEVLGGFELPDEVARTGSGRLQLARWIASKDNPLTARVIVNRVWQRHFGKGLVASTSDFGLRGQTPTHPELLDWLARDFMDNGWSLKHLHRTIMNSRTWQLSSHDVPANLSVDPENTHYWKANRQRMDAESIRDTIMQIAGTLDPTPQTEPYPIPPQKQWKYTQHHPFKDEYASNKRSVYLMTKRLTAESYFQTFDGADPNVCTSNRDQSVTSLQALYFVNNEFFHEQADTFAKKLVSMSLDDEQTMDFAFRSILGRSPSMDESLAMRRHFDAVGKRLSSNVDAKPKAWASLVRSLLRLNEFLYVD